MTLLLLGVLLTGAVLVWMAIDEYFDYRETIAEEQSVQEVTELQARINHLDAALAMAARMSVETGEERWRERYDAYAMQLDAAVQQAVEMDGDWATAGETWSAHQARRTLEERAFELAEEGRPNAAAGVLESNDRALNRHRFIEGIELLWFEEATPDPTLRLPALRGSLLRLDENLAGAARMAALTGDPAWSADYRQYLQDMELTLTEVEDSAPTAEVAEAVEALSTANDERVEVEQRALDHVEAGRLEAARELVQGSD